MSPLSLLCLGLPPVAHVADTMTTLPRSWRGPDLRKGATGLLFRPLALALTSFGLLQELGTHRGDVPLNDDAAVCDLLRRAFWSLLVLDSEISAATGRPPHIAPGSYDAPLPVREWDGVADPNVAAFVLLVEAAELLRKSVETMVRRNRSHSSSRKLNDSRAALQYSIANQSRTKTWTLQQMAMLTAEIDAFQYALPPRSAVCAAAVSAGLTNIG